MLKIKVNNQNLCLSEEVIAENSAEFASFSVSFSSEWDGYEKTVRFRHANSKTVYDVVCICGEGEYFIPAEVLHRGRVYISCIGVKGSGSIATATRESFEVRGSLISGEGTVPTVTPNAYAQYVELVKDRSEEVNSAAERAQQYAAEAEEARDNALMSYANAEKSASAARKAQMRAEDFASAAALSEVSAKSSLSIVMSNVTGLDTKCEEKKNELDSYTELKKSNIDAYAEKTYLEVADYADSLKKDFSADANMIITNFDVNYATKNDFLAQRADEYLSEMSQHSENVQKYAQEASDSAFSASVCKNQTLNALSSTLESEQRASEYADRAAASSEKAAEKAAEVYNIVADVYPLTDSFYTKEQADKRFSSAFYSYKTGDSLYLDDSDTDTELESLTVYGNTIRSHIPSSQNPCEITSFDGNIIFCGENVLDLDKCEFLNISRENEVMTAQLEAEDSCAVIRLESFIPFLRAGQTYTLTVKSNTVANKEKTIVNLGNAEFVADAASGFVTFTVPYTWDMSAFNVFLSYFEDEQDRVKRTRTYTCLGLNRGISPVYTPYDGYTLAIGTPMNGITVYNGRDGNPASKICDTMEYRNGELILTQRIGKAILKGASLEEWTHITPREPVDVLSFSCRIDKKGNYPVICDHFEYRGVKSEKYNDQITTNGQVTDIYIQISKETLNWNAGLTKNQILTAMKEWVSENNVTVYFVLNRPVEKKISTNTLFPYKNIYCDFPGILMEAEYKSERIKTFPCVVSNTVCGKAVEMSAAAEGMPFEKTVITGESLQQIFPTPDEPQDIEGFGSVVIAYKGTNLTNSQIYTAQNAVCTNGIVAVTVPVGENHAILYDETLNYALEGGKTYNLCVECDREPAQDEKIGIDINGTAFYSEAGSRNITFTVPDGIKENSVSIYLCHFDTAVTEPQTRIYGAIRVTEGEASMPYEQYKGSLIFLNSKIETANGEVDAVLRGCGDVRDRIIVYGKTGILEKRTGLLKPSRYESVEFVKDYPDGVTAEFIVHPKNYQNGHVYCNIYGNLSENDLQTDGLEGLYSTEKGIAVRVLTEFIEGYSTALTSEEKCTLFQYLLWDYSPVFQYPLKCPERYDISESNFCKSIMRLRTVDGGRIASIFDTGNMTPSFGTVKGNISVTYPCEIAEFVNFKIAEAIKA